MKAARTPLWKRIAAVFSSASYPLPPGSQNNDGFERNLDQRLTGVPHRELMLSTVKACVRLIAGTTSTLPLFLYRRTLRGRELAVDEDLYTLLHDSPNADMTAQTFWQAYVASLLLNGEAYGEKKIGTAGRVVAIDYLDFDRMSWTTENGMRHWWYTDRDGQRREIPRDRLFRTLGFTIDGVCGISAIQYGARVFNSAQLADIAANRTFVNGLMPTVAFSMEKVLSPAQRTEFRADFKTEIGGAINAGKPPLLEGGMKAFALGINPQDAQLLESRAWSVEEICRWFGVPPFMVGHSEKSTSWGTGLEQQNLGFLTYCLRPILKGIEQTVSKDLMTVAQRRQFYAEFAIDALLRADSAGRAALYASATQNGWMTREEIRELENLPFIAGAAMLTAQSNLTTLEMLGKEPVAPAPVEDAIKALFLSLKAAERPVEKDAKPSAFESAVLSLFQKSSAPPTINVHPPSVNVAAPVVNLKMPDQAEPVAYSLERKAVRDEETGLISSSIDTFTPINRGH